MLSRMTYDSFGNLVNVPAIVPTFTFTGRDYDDASGLYNYRARWYDARNGIFVSNDPIGFAAGDTNLSRYVGNSPLQFTDPTGNFAFLAAIPLYYWAAGGLIASGAAAWGYASYSEANPNSSWAMQDPERIKWVRGSGKVLVAIGMGMAMPFVAGYLAAAYPTAAGLLTVGGLGLTGLEAYHLATTDKSQWTAGDYFENFAPLVAGAVSGFVNSGRYFDGVRRGMAGWNRGAGPLDQTLELFVMGEKGNYVGHAFLRVGDKARGLAPADGRTPVWRYILDFLYRAVPGAMHNDINKIPFAAKSVSIPISRAQAAKILRLFAAAERFGATGKPFYGMSSNCSALSFRIMAKAGIDFPLGGLPFPLNTPLATKLYLGLLGL